MDDLFRVSPAWAARTRFTGAPGALHLEPVDLSVLLLVAGRLAECQAGDAGDPDHFASGMRHLRDLGDAGSSHFTMHVQASELGLRVPQFAKTIDRLRHAHNRGERCFASVTMMRDGKAADFAIANNVAILTAHRCFAPRLSPMGISRQAMGYRLAVPFADRAYVDVSPSLFAGFKSVSSAPVALRLMSWLTARSPEGLPPDHRCEVDEHDRWLIRATHETVAATLGITTSRAALGYYQELFPRIAADLLPLGFHFRAVAEPVHRRATNWRVRFHRLDRFVDQSSPLDDGLDEIDHADDGGESRSMLQRIVADSRRGMDEPSPAEVIAPEPVEAVPVAAPEPNVRPRPAPRGRMKGNVAIDPDDVAAPKDVSEPVVAPLPIDDGRNGKKPIAAPVIPRAALAMRDVRPPWLRRRLIHRHPMLPNVYADRPLDSFIACEDAYRVGVHVWADGLGAQPERIQGMSAIDGAVAVGKLWDYATRRLEWVNWLCTYPDGVWEPEDHQHLDRPHDDPEDDLPASKRSKPRDPLNVKALPHDGLGFVDDDGNPIDGAGRPMDRTEVEQEWDDRVQTPVDVV